MNWLTPPLRLRPHQSPSAHNGLDDEAAEGFGLEVVGAANVYVAHLLEGVSLQQSGRIGKHPVLLEPGATRSGKGQINLM